jgi:hypothetical protein
MKYILLMSSTKAGVDTYHAWSQKDIEAQMAVLGRINTRPMCPSNSALRLAKRWESELVAANALVGSCMRTKKLLFLRKLNVLSLMSQHQALSWTDL